MNKKFDETNQIDSTASIHPIVKLGKYNRIGKNVIIDVLKGCKSPSVVIGDNNIINDGTRILVGDGGLLMLDWNVLHNDMLVMAEKQMKIGHNCWFGQNTILDSAGGLEIGNGVRVGMYSQIWTHVASGELIEGCTLFAKRKTIIEDDVWLVGSCVVSSGLILRKKSIFLINSVVTKDAEPNLVYAGAPAKVMERINFWKPISLDEKFNMMYDWVNEFIKNNPEISANRIGNRIIEIRHLNEKGIIRFVESYTDVDSNILTEFNLLEKTFKKKNTQLERDFYRFIYNHKARFIPLA